MTRQHISIIIIQYLNKINICGYQKNNANFIPQLRRELDTPKVCARVTECYFLNRLIAIHRGQQRETFLGSVR